MYKHYTLAVFFTIFGILENNNYRRIKKRTMAFKKEKVHNILVKLYKRDWMDIVSISCFLG